MSDSNHIQSIAIVGASGNVGTAALKELLAADRFNITLILRPNSKTAALPSSSSITIKQGSWDDTTFLQDAFKGQDALLLALGFMGMGEQPKLIEAAAKAGVKWILPTEYAGDGLNEAMTSAVPVFQGKVQARKHIEELATKYEGLKWIGVATNPWVEQSLRIGLFGIKFGEKKAKLYPDGGRINTSTVEQVGLGIARVLSLPIHNDKKPRASLEHYANNFVYISSMFVTQEELFESVLRATKTKESEWDVDRESTIEQWIKDSRERMSKGDRMAGLGLTFAFYLGKGLGGDYQSKALEDMEVLNMKEQDLDEQVLKAVAAGALPAPF